MQKRILIILLLISFLHGGAQTVANIKKTDTSTKAAVYLEQAKVFYYSDNFSDALPYFQLALKESELLKDSINIYLSLFRIGEIHARNNNLNTAENYFIKAMQIAKKINNSSGISNCNIGFFHLYLRKGDFNNALYNINEAFEIKKTLQDSAGIVLCLNNIGVIYGEMNDLIKEKYFYEKALIYLKKNDIQGAIIGLVNISYCYSELNQNTKAIENLNKALKLSDLIMSKDIKHEIYESLSEAYAKSKNYQKSLYYYKLHSDLKDSVFNITSIEKINQLESKYQFEKKQKEIIQLTADNQKSQILLSENKNKLNKRTFILGFIGTALILILIFGYFLFRQYKEKEQINKALIVKNNEISEQKEQIQLNLNYTQKLQEAIKHELNHYIQLALSKQMNPHFIFNSLNSIQSYILQNDKLSANIYLSKFADLMRKILENSQHEFVTIKKELSTLELYIELEQKRFENKFEFQLTINDSINPNYFLISPLLLQPYLENAIWHGLMHKQDNGILKLVINKHGSNILFSITDNGIGMEAAAKRKSLDNSSRESLGTKITAKRLELINSLKNTDIAVEFINLKDEKGSACGTTVNITIPTINAFEKS